MPELDQKARIALKHSYLELIVEKIGGEIVPEGVAVTDECGEVVVINPIVKKNYDLAAAREAMVERERKAVEKAEKAAKKAAEKSE